MPEIKDCPFRDANKNCRPIGGSCCANEATDICTLLQELASCRKGKELIGTWPVTLGTTFGGSKIVAADYRQQTVTLKWEKPVPNDRKYFYIIGHYVNCPMGACANGGLR